MRFQVDAADERPLYRQIVDEVRSSVHLGLLRPGDRLPGVRELAAQLGVNLHTVRRAYSALAEQNVVTVRRGAGTHVRDLPSNQNVLDRDHLLREIAARALTSANRHGFSAEQLTAAVHRVDLAWTPAAWIAPSPRPPAPAD